MTFLIGLAVGVTLTIALLGYLERPVKRLAPTPIGAQWTPEAAETLVRGWSK